MAQLEGWSLDQARARCLEVDRTRELFTRYFFGDAAMQPAQYDLVVNTARVPLDDVRGRGCRHRSARSCRGRAAARQARSRVDPLAGTGGRRDRALRLPWPSGWRCSVYDRELLEQEAVRLGVPEAEMEKIDERPAGIFQRFRPGSIYQRYFEALAQIMRELAERGDVILVGRGGNCFLRDDPRAFHVRLVAPMPVRVRRVMEYRWVRESVAKKLDCRERRPTPQLLRKLLRRRLGQPVGIPRYGQQRPAGAGGPGPGFVGRRASLEPHRVACASHAPLGNRSWN